VIEHRRGSSKVGRQTKRKKLNTGLKEMKGWLKSVRNIVKIKEWWKVLAVKLRGYYECYGIIGNHSSIRAFYRQTCRLVLNGLNGGVRRIA